MKITPMNRVGGDREYVTAFLGLNRQNTAIDSSKKQSMEMQDEDGISSRQYPYLCCVTPKKTVKALGVSTSDTTFTMIDKQGKTLMVYALNGLTPKAYVWNMTDNTDVSNHSVTNKFPKTFVKMGAKVIIHPDMLVYDTVAGTWDSIAASVDYSMAAIYPCTMDGVAVSCYTSNTPPATPQDGEYLYELSTGKYFQYSVTQGKWVESQGYFLFATPDTMDVWKEGDTLHFSSAHGMEADYHLVIDGDPRIEKKWAESGTIYHILKGYFNDDVPDTGEGLSDVVISRRVPDMDFICESGNRLWGCYYGNDYNEIYASALGNPFAWYLFEGTSMDSYAASIGDDGQFTGAIAYNGRPMFFKENMIYSVYGMYPAQFQINKQESIGIKKGCKACVFNNVLYYGSHEGVCAYTGSLPSVISHRVGDLNATAIDGEGHILYVADNGDLYTYDTEHNIWDHYGKNDFDTRDLFGYGGKMYFSAEDQTGAKILSSDAATTGLSDIEWYAITPRLNMRTPDSSYLQEIQIRTEFVDGKSLKAYISYDEGSYDTVADIAGGGNTWRDVQRYKWEDVANVTWSQLKANKIGVYPYVVHIRLKRASTCRIKLVGVGDIRIISMTKNWRYGSDSTWR